MSIFLIFFGCGVCFATNIYSQSTFLTLNLKDKTVKDVFSEIEKSSEYIFFYYDGVLDLERKVTIDVQNQLIDVILNQLFASTNNDYTISDRQIIITRQAEETTPPPPTAQRTPSAPQQQGIRITGTVSDNFGEPLPGVSVLVLGTTQGTTTDMNGEFAINVPDGDATLEFNF